MHLAHAHTHLHAEDEGHLQQRSFFLGPTAEIHPSQSRCHLGSRVESEPAHTNMTQLR